MKLHTINIQVFLVSLKNTFLIIFLVNNTTKIQQHVHVVDVTILVLPSTQTGLGLLYSIRATLTAIITHVDGQLALKNCNFDAHISDNLYQLQNTCAMGACHSWPWQVGQILYIVCSRNRPLNNSMGL